MWYRYGPTGLREEFFLDFVISSLTYSDLDAETLLQKIWEILLS